MGYREPSLIVYCTHNPDLGGDCIPQRKSIASVFPGDGTAGASFFPCIITGRRSRDVSMGFATLPVEFRNMPRTRFLSEASLSVVEIGGGFSYDGSILRRILSTPSVFIPDRQGKNTQKGGED